jgi:hypothetical protein
MVFHRSGRQIAVADVAFDERDIAGDDASVAGRKVVEDDYEMAGIPQRQDDVAANISGSAGHKNAHGRRTSLDAGAKL